MRIRLSVILTAGLLAVAPRTRAQNPDLHRLSGNTRGTAGTYGRFQLAPGQEMVLADLAGPGKIARFCFTAERYERLAACAIDRERGAELRGEPSRLHAQRSRSNTVPESSIHAILEATGRGHYAGNFLEARSDCSGLWGDGSCRGFDYGRGGRQPAHDDYTSIAYSRRPR